MKKLPGYNLLHFAILALTLLCGLRLETKAAEADAATALKTNEPSVAELRLSTNVEAEILLTRQALDQLRREVEQSAVRNAAAITSSLGLVESALARMHERQMQSAQSANRTILIVSGAFAALGLVCLLLISLVLMRAIGRFSEVAAGAPAQGHLLGPGQAVAALGAGDMATPRRGAEEASGRFQSALEQLQRRIVELEQSAQPSVSGNAAPRAVSPRPPEEQAGSTVDIQPLLPDDEPAATEGEDGAAPASRATVLLGKGQALLNLDSAEPALKCFEEALALEPNNAEAFVRKGMALEKLQDWEQALESYDRAIEADQFMTVAYLYRGGVCNRLQRYREALESYEQALHTEKKSQAS